MKKSTIFSILGVVLLVLSAVAAAGCTSSDNKTTLVMATNAEFQPYEYYDGGAIVGIDVEMMNAVAKKLGMTLKIEDMAFDSIITAVTSAKADVGAAAMTVTEDRKKNIDFSDTYATSKQVIIVNTKNNPKKIAGANDIEGATIGVQLGTTGDIYVSDYEGDDAGTKIERYNKISDAFLSLEQGKIDCIVVDEQSAIKQSSGQSKLKILKEEFTNEDYATVVKKGNTELLNKINKALAELKADGTLDAIIAKYTN